MRRGGRYGWLAALLVLALGAWPAVSHGERPPVARAAAACSDYPNQAAAQRAADTRDSDGDGIYCESLPCPCSFAAGGGDGSGNGDTGGTNRSGCTRPRGLQRVVFSAAKYPNIRAHFRAAVRRGWPLRLVVNRAGADERRDRLLGGIQTRPAVTRTTTAVLTACPLVYFVARGRRSAGVERSQEREALAARRTIGLSRGGDARRPA